MPPFTHYEITQQGNLMQITTNKIDSANAKINAAITRTTIDANVEKIANQLSKDAKIAGFRKGKVPLSAVKKQYGDRLVQDAEAQALRDLLNEGLKLMAIEAETLIGEPNITKFEKTENGIDVEVTVATRPAIELGDYASMVPEVAKPAVDDAAVTARIEELASAQAPLVNIEEDRALVSGDSALLDFEGFVDGEPFEGGKAENFSLRLGSGQFIPGFEDQVIGMKKGDEKTIDSCYGCHVSQLSSNYDLKTDTYKTTWAEPGINCEACHGPSAEHNRVFREAPKGQKPEDIKIISWKNFTPEQKNAACSICHAKMSPVTATFAPGDRFFDHFDLATLEDPDFYPDGRDLGENYTYTSWMMSPCAKAGKLDCVTCHTSSGRYRFKAEEKANDACMPCHEKHVKDATAHTHHKEGSAGNKCISCHMPMTSFARMNRTDHSMLPPTPAATHCLQVAQCLQSLPHGQGRRLGRQICARVAHPGLPGAGAPTRIPYRRRRASGTGRKLPEMLELHYRARIATRSLRRRSSAWSRLPGTRESLRCCSRPSGTHRPWCAPRRPKPCKMYPRKKPFRPSWRRPGMTTAWFASGLPRPLRDTRTSPWMMPKRKPSQQQTRSTSPRSSPARTSGAPITIWATIIWTAGTSSRPSLRMTRR